MSARRTAARLNEKTSPKNNVVRLEKASASNAARLPSGAHFAKLCRKLGDRRYEAHLFGGEVFDVGLLPEVEQELADRCLAEQEVVLIGALGADVVLFGALCTKARQPEVLVVEGPRKLVLRAGKSKIELFANGKVKICGNEVSIDAPREVRIASAHVEIP